MRTIRGMSAEPIPGSEPSKPVGDILDQTPMRPEDADVLRRMIKSIEGDKDRTHLVFIKVLGGNSRVYSVGPADRTDLTQLKNLLLPFEATSKRAA